MKSKKILIPVAALLVSTFMFQSCIGSFSLTNKVLTWNRSVNNKFVNELVFFAFWVLPVYEVTAIADLLVINSIEFWSGNKPLEAHNQVISTEEGNYKILADETGYEILTPDGRTMHFLFDENSKTWSMSVNNGSQTDFLKFKEDGNIMMPNKMGEFVDVELSPEGKENYLSDLMMPVFAEVQ